MESLLMNSQLDTNRVAPETREARGEWLSAFSLVLFFISITVFDARIMMDQNLLPGVIFLPFLIFLQGYAVWYYFYRFRPTRKMFRVHGPKIVSSYLWLFVLAMVGTSVVVLIGCYLFR